MISVVMPALLRELLAEHSLETPPEQRPIWIRQLFPAKRQDPVWGRVRWQSGDAADCKSANVGSIPARTSNACANRERCLLRAHQWAHAYFASLTRFQILREPSLGPTNDATIGERAK